MTQDEMINECFTKDEIGLWIATDQNIKDFAKLVAEKAIQPYLPYKEKIEAMERAYDAHFAKAMGQ